MGEVYHSVQLGTRRDVALKLMRGALASEHGRLRFDREVELTARLDHPHIARVFDSGIHQGVYFYAMELIEGPPLDEYIQRNNLDPRQIVEMFRKVCQAITHAHQRGVIHRDLKPTNILVDKAGHPHVLDFGLAKALADTTLVGISVDGELAGTPAFMSPEQAAGRLDRLDTRTDVYSLGVILFNLLTGEFPHNVKGPHHEVVRRICQEDARRPRQVKPTLDRELEALLLKTLAKDPESRYASAGELTRDVENYLSGDPLVAKPPTTIYFLRKRLWKYRLPLGIAAAILLVLAIMAVLSYVNIVHERDLARIAEANAQHQTELARIERRNAELRRGEGLVAEGDVLGSAGRWADAKSRYAEAHDLFVAEQASPLKADIGMWNAYRFSPPPLGIIPGVKGDLIDLAISAGGRQAVGASKDGKIRVWDLTTSQLTNTITDSDHPIWSIALSADGRFALAGSADGNAKLWNLQTAEPIHTLGPLNGWVTRVAIDPNARMALTVSGETADSLAQERNDVLTLWDLQTARAARTLQASGRVTRAVFSPDGSLLATAGEELALWNVAAGSKIHSYPGGGQLTSIAFSPDGRSLLTGGADTYVRLWNVSSDRQPIPIGTHASPIENVSFSPDGRLLFSVADDGSLKIWDAATDVEIRKLSDSGGDLRAAAFSADGRIAACASADETLTIWNLLPPPEVRDIPVGDGELAAVHVFPSQFMAMTRSLGHLALWDLPTGYELPMPKLAVAPVEGSALSPDGKTAAVLSPHELVLLDTRTWRVTSTVPISRRPNSQALLAFSPDARLLLTPGPDFSISVRAAADGREIHRLIGHKAPVTALVFSPDSQKALTGGRDGSVRLWDVNTGELIRTLTGHKDAVHAVAFSPDGHLGFSGGGNSAVEFGSDDFSLRIWDLTTGQCQHTLTGHNARIRALSVNPEGSIVVSASDDQTLKLWDLRTGQEMRTLSGHTAPVVAVSFSPDGQSILSGGQDHLLKIWDFSIPRRRRELLARPGERYALLGLDDWASDLLSREQAAGQSIPTLTLARCLWRSGQPKAAIAEIRLARQRSEAPADYLSLCIEALGASK